MYPKIKISLSKKVIYKIIDSRQSKIRFYRPAEYGGNIECDDYDDVVKNIVSGNIHPVDFKTFISKFLIELLEPVRNLLEVEEFIEAEKLGY